MTLKEAVHVFTVLQFLQIRIMIQMFDAHHVDALLQRASYSGVNPNIYVGPHLFPVDAHRLHDGQALLWDAEVCVCECWVARVCYFTMAHGLLCGLVVCD